MIIREPKKYDLTRVILPNKTLLKGKTRKSFKNWIGIWRPKVENRHSGNALYLQPDGHPLQIHRYRMFMTRKVRPVFPEYQPYVSRHWCAIAKLINTKLETKRFDRYDVRD